MLSFSEIKIGKVVLFQNQPYLVTKADFLKMNRAKPSKKCKLKNILDGSVVEYTYKSGESAEEADIRRENATFMYKDQNTIAFMTSENFETVELDSDILGHKVGFLKPEAMVQILYFNDVPVSVEIPIKVSLEVTHTVDVEKGNSVSDVMKDAELETGITIKVPAFIKIGDKVIVNTDEEVYVERDTGNKGF
jgi:elongation factor P